MAEGVVLDSASWNLMGVVGISRTDNLDNKYFPRAKLLPRIGRVPDCQNKGGTFSFGTVLLIIRPKRSAISPHTKIDGSDQTPLLSFFSSGVFFFVLLSFPEFGI